MQGHLHARAEGRDPEGKVIGGVQADRSAGRRILDRIFSQGIPFPKEITALFPAPPGITSPPRR